MRGASLCWWQDAWLSQAAFHDYTDGVGTKGGGPLMAIQGYILCRGGGAYT